MAEDLGSAVLTLRTDGSQLSSGLVGAEKQISAFGSGATAAGRSLMMGLTLPIIGVGGAALKMGLDFEDSLSLIRGLVGVSQEQINAWKEDIFELSRETAQSPKILADALYFITSSGLSGAKAMEALKASAFAAAAGLGEASIVADALTSALNAYATSGLTADRASSILVETVRLGKGEADALAGAIGRVIPVASQMGVSFDQVGAAVAGMTLQGLNAEEAVTALRGIMLALMSPTEQAGDALKTAGMSAEESVIAMERMKDSSGELDAQLVGVGLSAQGLREQLAERGLLSVLQTLKDAFGDNVEAMTAVFGNVRALVGAYALVGENAATTANIFGELAGVTGEEVYNAFEAVAEGPAFTMRQAFNLLTVELTRFGDALAPLAADAAVSLGGVTRQLQGLVSAFTELPVSVQKAILVGALLVAALGPVLFIVGGVASGVAALTPLWAALGASLVALASPVALVGTLLAALTTPIGLVVVALGFLAVAAYLVITRWDEMAQSAPELQAAIVALGQGFLVLGEGARLLKDAVVAFGGYLMDHEKQLIAVLIGIGAAMAIAFPHVTIAAAALSIIGSIKLIMTQNDELSLSALQTKESVLGLVDSFLTVSDAAGRVGVGILTLGLSELGRAVGQTDAFTQSMIDTHARARAELERTKLAVDRATASQIVNSAAADQQKGKYVDFVATMQEVKDTLGEHSGLLSDEALKTEVARVAMAEYQQQLLSGIPPANAIINIQSVLRKQFGDNAVMAFRHAVALRENVNAYAVIASAAAAAGEPVQVFGARLLAASKMALMAAANAALARSTLTSFGGDLSKAFSATIDFARAQGALASAINEFGGAGVAAGESFSDGFSGEVADLGETAGTEIAQDLVPAFVREMMRQDDVRSVIEQAISARDINWSDVARLYELGAYVVAQDFTDALQGKLSEIGAQIWAAALTAGLEEARIAAWKAGVEAAAAYVEAFAQGIEDIQSTITSMFGSVSQLSGTLTVEGAELELEILLAQRDALRDIAELEAERAKLVGQIAAIEKQAASDIALLEAHAAAMIASVQAGIDESEALLSSLEAQLRGYQDVLDGIRDAADAEVAAVQAGITANERILKSLRDQLKVKQETLKNDRETLDVYEKSAAVHAKLIDELESQLSSLQDEREAAWKVLGMAPGGGEVPPTLMSAAQNLKKLQDQLKDLIEGGGAFDINDLGAWDASGTAATDAYQDLVDQIAEATSVFNELDQQVQDEIQAARDQLAIQTELLAQDQQMIDAMLAKIEIDQAAIDATEALIAATQDEIEQARERIAEIKAAAAEQAAIIQAQIDATRDLIQATKDKIAEDEKMIANIKAYTATQVAAIQEIADKQIAALEKQIAKVDASIASIKAHVAALQAEKAAREADLRIMELQLQLESGLLKTDAELLIAIENQVRAAELLQGVYENLTSGVYTLHDATLAAYFGLKNLALLIEQLVANPALGSLGLPSFNAGGYVPGNLGEPMMAIVHGGEKIIPPGGTEGATVTLTQHFHGPADPVAVEQATQRGMNRSLRSAGLLV